MNITPKSKSILDQTHLHSEALHYCYCHCAQTPLQVAYKLDKSTPDGVASLVQHIIKSLDSSPKSVQYPFFDFSPPILFHSLYTIVN